MTERELRTSRDREIRRALHAAAAEPDAAARERTWRVVQAAYRERAPERRPRRLVRAVAIAVPLALAGAAGGAAAMTPHSGVGRLVRDVLGIGAPNTRPALVRVPGGGRLLVQDGESTWVVAADGTRRRLGSYAGASWSPHGLFVVAWRNGMLSATEPNGSVRWSLSRPAPITAARWSPVDGYRIAYLAGSSLRVVNGDGTDDRALARDVLATPPAWRPGTHELAYAAADGSVRIADADAGRVLRAIHPSQTARELEWTGTTLLVRGRNSLVALGPGNRRIDALGPGAAEVVDAALSPDGTKVAFVQEAGGRSTLWLYPRLRPDATAARRIFSGAGRFDTVTWSPDGRWLLVGWRSADQWLFIRSTAVRKVVAVSNIAATFGPDASIAGWCCS
jgi:WD40 repeat protein